MNNSVYDLDNQNNNLTNKILVGLERIAEAYRAMLWEKAKEFKLSPIQIQILVFIHSHKQQYCKVSYLANEFNVTKATISDSVKTLTDKNYLSKKSDKNDSRSQIISLTEEGRGIISELNDYSSKFLSPLSELSSEKQENLWEYISKILLNLHSKDIINVNRMCVSCKYYSNIDDRIYCALLEKELKQVDIRIDCPEHIEK